MKYTPNRSIPVGTLQEPFFVSTTRSNPVRDGCLTIKPRSPLAPLRSGGTGVFSFVPLFKGNARGLQTFVKARVLRGFRRLLTRRRALPCPYYFIHLEYALFGKIGCSQEVSHATYSSKVRIAHPTQIRCASKTEVVCSFMNTLQLINHNLQLFQASMIAF